MTEADPHRELLARATAALEGIERTVDRQAEAFDRQAEAFDRQAEAFDRQAEGFDRQEASFKRMMHRFELSEKLLIEAISEISIEVHRNSERLDDMGAAIRANTQAVLSALDRLGPAPG